MKEEENTKQPEITDDSQQPEKIISSGGCTSSVF